MRRVENRGCASQRSGELSAPSLMAATWLMRTMVRSGTAAAFASGALIGTPAAQAEAEHEARGASTQSKASQPWTTWPTVPRLELNYPGERGGYATSASLGLKLRFEIRGITSSDSSEPRREGPRPSPFDWAPTDTPQNASWIGPARGLWTTGTTYPHPSIPTDDRSAWARWHGSIWGATATVGVLMGTMVATLSLLPSDVSGWNKPNFHGLKKNFTHGPNFDYDHAYFNYLAHPYYGSEFYLIARNRDFNWWQSFLYAAGVSTFFEFCIESAYEGASWQDLWITPVSGAVIGELRWQAKKALENPSTGKPVGTANKILYVVVDPLDSLLSL